MVTDTLGDVMESGDVGAKDRTERRGGRRECKVGGGGRGGSVRTRGV